MDTQMSMHCLPHESDYLVDKSLMCMKESKKEEKEFRKDSYKSEDF